MKTRKLKRPTRKPLSHEYSQILQAKKWEEKGNIQKLGGAPTETIKIKKLNPNTILRFSEFPDFRKPSLFPWPIVVWIRGKNTFLCLDGWEKIETARTTKSKNLDCYVIQTDDISTLDLSIMKLRGRTVPQGGWATYSEIVRGVRQIYHKEVLAEGCHMKGKTDEQIRNSLARSLDTPPAVINRYLAHSEYLGNAALNILASWMVEEDFFERFQPLKRLIAKTLLHQGLSRPEIGLNISRIIPSTYREYVATGKVSKAKILKKQDEWLVKDRKYRTWKKADQVFEKPQVLKYTPPNGKDLPGPLTNQREIKVALTNVLKGLARVFGLDPRLTLDSVEYTQKSAGKHLITLTPSRKNNLSNKEEHEHETTIH
jgi:hypothetical protein